MAINPYVNLQASSDFKVFEFESSGKVILRKRAVFDLIDESEQIYNLALCTVLEDNTEDYDTASKNGDMDTVLETVAFIAVLYSNKFPERKIYFRGSTPSRSRKYQMGVNRHLTTLMETFTIEGIVIDENGQIVLREDFKVGKNYSALLFTKKPD